MNGRGLGCVRDSYDGRDKGVRALIEHAASSPAPCAIGKADMRRYRGERIEQGHAGACVSFAKARAIFMSMKIQGVENPPMISPLFDYRIARLQPYAGRPLAEIPPLEDAGSQPRLSMQATRRVGFVPWGAWAYDPDRVNEDPPPEVTDQSYDQRGFTFYRVDAGPASGTSTALAIRAGYPTIFGMRVDRAFMNHRGSDPIRRVNDAEIVGGHMMAVLAVEDDGTILADNWWGDGWGFDDGLVRIAPEVFNGDHVFDRYAIRAVPVFPEG